MSENGHEAVSPQPQPLASGHLVVYDTGDGQGLLCFRPDGGDDDSVVRQPMIGMVLGPLVAMLTGQPAELDLSGANGKMMRRVAKVMGLGT